MKRTHAVLVGLFSFGISPMAFAQLSPEPAPAETTAGVGAVVDTADYVQISALPFIYRSQEREIKTGMASAKTDSSGSSFGAISPTLYFKAGFDRFVLRALLAGTSPLDTMGRLHGGFRLTDLLEVGAYLAGARVNGETGDTSSATTSFFYFGPYGRLAMDLGGRLSLEAEIRLGIGLGSEKSEMTVGGTTTTTEVDRGGFELAVSGALVRNLTSNIDYTAMLEIGLNTFKREPGMTEDERSITSISIFPLGLRYRF
jgi:hypothetical protein